MTGGYPYLARMPLSDTFLKGVAICLTPRREVLMFW